MSRITTQHTRSSVFTLFKQAVRGDIKDFTTGSIDRAIFLLAVPMVLEMMLESSFAIVDIFFVNQVGAAATSTVILTEASLTILYSVAWGLAMGVTALVARRAGEKNFTDAAGVAMQAIIIAGAFSLLISIIGLVFPKEILAFMGAGKETVRDNFRFTQLMLGANMVIMFLFVNNGIFRGAGDASIAMRALMIANIINIILDPLLIKGIGPFPKMGLMGAAVATTIGRGIGVIYQFYHLFKGKDLVQLRLDQLRVKWKIIRQILNTSYGGMFQFLIGSCSWIFLARIIASGGPDVTAGYGTAIRICIFTILPAWGIANAAATLTGQNLGAQLPDRAEESVWRSAFLAFCFFALVGLIFFFFGHSLMQFFTPDPIAIREGTLCLRILAIGYVFFAYGMVLSQAFNGAGDTRTPTIINIIAFWVIQIPLAYLLADYLKMGSKGVYITIGVSESILAIITIVVFKKGRWKLVKI